MIKTNHLISCKFLNCLEVSFTCFCFKLKLAIPLHVVYVQTILELDCLIFGV